jgi:hypothetical protein
MGIVITALLSCDCGGVIGEDFDRGEVIGEAVEKFRKRVMTSGPFSFALADQSPIYVQ